MSPEPEAERVLGIPRLVWSRIALVTVGLVGVGLLAAGAHLTLREAASPAPLIGAGLALLLVAVFHDRITSIKVGSGGVELSLVSNLQEIGAPDLAASLEHTDLPALAMAYATVHAEIDEKSARTVVQDRLVNRAAELASYRSFDPRELQRAFHRGGPALRVLVLGIMEGNPSLAREDVLRTAIEGSLTGNEQYHGLRTLELARKHLGPDAVKELVEAAKANHWIQDPKAQSRREVLGRLEEALASDAPAPD